MVPTSGVSSQTEHRCWYFVYINHIILNISWTGAKKKPQMLIPEHGKKGAFVT